MKKPSLLLVALALALAGSTRGQEGPESAAPPVQFLPSIPRIDSIPSDWQTVFESDSAKKDFKQLRAYRARKQLLLDLSRPQVDVLRSSRETLEAGMAGRAPVERELVAVLRRARADTGTISVPSLSFEFDAEVGHATPANISVEDLRGTYRRLTEQDSIARINVAHIEALEQRLRGNIHNLEDDLRQAEAAIDSSLAPEYQSQKFRLWVSAFFSGLIAIMIVSFFATIYRKSGNDIGSLLLSDGGLQFITIFVLIIAIILFGILNILEGRELAAILSGIAGYILGRGARLRSDAARDGEGDQPPAPASGGAAAGPPKKKIRVFTPEQAPPPGEGESASESEESGREGEPGRSEKQEVEPAAPAPGALSP